MRVARGAAYPLITSLRRLSSVFVSGLGSTTAVALGTGLGVLRLGLGVVKFLVQLGVFASVLYTLLALDIDPVERLLQLLPMSEASQDRASRAVTRAMRGVFVSSLKLSAFHAGFTWLTLRAFDAHFVCLATAASAVVAVLPLVPVALVAAPAVLELALLRGAPVKALVLAALHLGAYYFGDDLIFREVEPTLPYLVGLGVFGGMYTFKNPLQGVLLGPMVLALLSVGYNLHRDLY
ncbi:hypothetical protein OEZ85_009932 [Tetradesmus obliquus]|nr:hypothetical protein OEZ85_009932 [Tetradesmus obliquus]